MTIYVTVPIERVADKNGGNMFFSFADACTDFYRDEDKKEKVGSVCDCVSAGGLQIHYGDDTYYLNPETLFREFIKEING